MKRRKDALLTGHSNIPFHSTSGKNIVQLIKRRTFQRLKINSIINGYVFILPIKVKQVLNELKDSEECRDRKINLLMNEELSLKF